MGYVLSDEWLEVVDSGSNEDFRTELGAAIDPLTRKVMNLDGERFAQTMSYELAQWIKDTSILWIKNKGAGNTTTENELLKMQEKARHGEEIRDITDYYENKLAE